MLSCGRHSLGMDVAGLFGMDEEDDTVGDEDLKEELVGDGKNEEAASKAGKYTWSAHLRQDKNRRYSKEEKAIFEKAASALKSKGVTGTRYDSYKKAMTAVGEALKRVIPESNALSYDAKPKGDKYREGRWYSNPISVVVRTNEIYKQKAAEEGEGEAENEETAAGKRTWIVHLVDDKRVKKTEKEKALYKKAAAKLKGIAGIRYSSYKEAIESVTKALKGVTPNRVYSPTYDSRPTGDKYKEGRWRSGPVNVVIRSNEVYKQKAAEEGEGEAQKTQEAPAEDEVKTKEAPAAKEEKKLKSPLPEPEQKTAPAETEEAPAPAEEKVVEQQDVKDDAEQAPVETEGKETAAPLPGGTATIPLSRYATGCVSLVRSGPRLYAMMEDNGNYICVGTKEASGDTHGFENAISVACSEGKDAVEKVLVNNGFVMSTVNMAYDKFIMDQVDKRDAVMQSEYKEKLENLGSAVQQSMAIAMCGMHRGFFKEMDNPMAKALVTSLTAHAGMDEHRAREMIVSAMEEAGDQYASMVRDKTLDLMQKSDESRNELAELVGELRGGGVNRFALAGNGSGKEEAGARVLPSNLVGERQSLDERLKAPLREVPRQSASADGGETQKRNGRKTRVDELAAGLGGRSVFARIN